MNDSFDLQKSQFSDPYLSSPRNHFISYPLTMALDGKVALITGGVKNLGAESARELAGIGASLALHYNSESSKASATSLEAELREKYPDRKVAFYQGDLTSAGNVDKLFQSVLKDFGKIDIVVNTVGKVLKKPITDISEEDYDSMFA
jgi:NAD(P)-dependent dehydrogenase (short-subunit alcohol dehydrogenase family)